MSNLEKFISALTGFFKLLFHPVIWISNSFLGRDGKASGKKLTAAFITLVTGLYATKVHDMITLYAFIALLIAVLLMWGIISSTNIITMTRILKNKDTNTGKEGDKDV